jgi:hypothetical protein
MLYFTAEAVDHDPAVYSYLEGDAAPELVAEHFSSFLENEVEQKIVRFHESMKHRKPFRGL